MKLSKEEEVVAKAMAERGKSVRRLADQLGVTEGALRYRLKKLEEGPGKDGRAGQPTVAGRIRGGGRGDPAGVGGSTATSVQLCMAGTI